MAVERQIHRSVRWHEANVLRLAVKFSDTFVMHAGYGGPVARAACLLNEGVEQLQAARKRPSTSPGAKHGD